MRSLMVLAGILLMAEAPSAAANLSRIDEYLQKEMALNAIPGASVAVAHRGELIYAKGFGVRSTTTGEPMSADTPVDLASLSKSFTAMAVMELDHQDRLDLDAPVTRYLPELGAAFSRIKLHHLIRHRSGLTRQDDTLLLRRGAPERFDLERAAARLSAAKPRRGTRAAFEYANSNYVLLAVVVERVAGQSFPAFMRDAVFRPLGMLRTTLDVTKARAWGLAEPHERRGRRIKPIPEAFLGWPGSSLVKSTAQDMGQYLTYVLPRAGTRGAEPYDRGWGDPSDNGP